MRTGVTVIVPGADDPWAEPAFAGCHRLNGNGELTGLEWIREAGLLTTVIGLTNTHSVGVVRDALIAAAVQKEAPGEQRWYLPVVGETYDGDLNDINGMHVRAEHVHAALESASGGPVAEGGVGSGTGMQCHGFKGGIGTASRVVDGSTVGVLVQANHGWRDRLQVNGIPVGPLPGEEPAGRPGAGPEGSIIVIVATDAPLLPGQCERLAQRAALGIGRVGGAGEHGSGDLILAFATGNRGLRPLVDHDTQGTGPVAVRAVPADLIDNLFYAVIEATEEAIVNALVAGETMTGRDGYTVQGIGGERLAEYLRARDALGVGCDLGSVRGRRRRPGEVAGGEVRLVVSGGKLRVVLRAHRLGERAAGMEPAAGWRVDRAWRVAHHRRRLRRPPRHEPRHRLQQPLRVWMPRVVEQLGGRRRLHDPAEVHHRNPVAHMPHDRHVVRDEQHRQPQLAAQLVQQVQHRRLHRHVERGHGLVGDQHVRLERERARDRDALALAAGELARVRVQRALAESDQVHQLAAARVDLRPWHHPVHPQQLGQGLAHGHARIQRRVGILEHHLHAPSLGAVTPSRERLPLP